MNLEDLNSKLPKRLDDLETERRKAIVDQLINDNQENLYEWQKAFLKSLLMSDWHLTARNWIGRTRWRY